MKKSLGAQTLAYPAPVWVVGTYDANGRPNMMTSSWAGICCSQPPCVNICLRKATHTYQSLLDRKAFTVNIPSAAQASEADYAGIVSGRDTDKFAATDLTPVRSGLVDAPMIQEFPLVLECRLKEHHVIGLHTLFVGEILDVKAEEAILGDSGLPDIRKLNPLSFAPESYGYFALGEFIGKAFHLGRSRG